MSNIFTNRILSFTLVFAYSCTPAAYADLQLKSVPGAYATADRKDDYETFFSGERFARTELYFGTARSNGLPSVTEQEFQDFLDNNITQAFPDGLTLLTGLGQFRGSDGVAIEEDSFLVILLYPEETKRQSSEKIEQIRRDYKEQYQQESVLRSDFCCERVGF